MAEPSLSPFSVVPPTASEAAALAVAAALARAGTRAARCLLADAALCDGVRDLPDRPPQAETEEE